MPATASVLPEADAWFARHGWEPFGVQPPPGASGADGGPICAGLAALIAPPHGGRRATMVASPALGVAVPFLPALR